VVPDGIQSRFFRDDAEALALWKGERTVTMPTANILAEIGGLQWRVINAMRALGLEPVSITNGQTIDAAAFKDLDKRLAAREKLFDADAARLPDWQQNWAPQFEGNVPRTMSVHLMVRVLDLFNKGPRQYQALNNQCLLANLMPAMSGGLADLGTVDGSFWYSGAALRSHQVVQLPDFHSFWNVRREIGANELPPAGVGAGYTCQAAVTAVHEFTHDLDLTFKDSYMNLGYDRSAACGPEYMAFMKPGSPFTETPAPGTQHPADYISGYAAGLSSNVPSDQDYYKPWEDAAETVTAYVLFPEYFRTKAAASARLRARYDYVKNEIFGGVEFRNTSVAPQSFDGEMTPGSPISQLCWNVREFRLDDVGVK